MDIIMPQLGETVEEGTVTVWYKKAGDAVSKGDVLFEVETDKVTTEIPASADGVLSEILVEEDETVPVGAKLAVLLVEGEEEVSEGPSDEEIEVIIDDEAPAKQQMAPQSGDGQAKLSPVVRKLIADHKLDINELSALGDGGRLTRKDVEKFIAEQGQEGVTIVPLNRVQIKTGERMVQAKNTAPHVFQGTEVNYGAVDAVRAAKGAGWKAEYGFSLTYLPFIAKATCMALQEYGRLNAHLDGERMLVHDQINLGIAVDLEFEGLMVPVIKDAGEKSVAELAQKIRDLAVRARSKSLTPDELSEATYTISNSGSFGTLFTAPIINLPQVAIMSTDGVTQKPVVDEEGTIVPRPVGVIAQSFDHRAIDGAYSAAFLKRVREIIETRDWSQEV